MVSGKIHNTAGGRKTVRSARHTSAALALGASPGGAGGCPLPVLPAAPWMYMATEPSAILPISSVYVYSPLPLVDRRN